MDKQTKKMLRWIVGGGMILLFLLIPELLISRALSNGNEELFRKYGLIMSLTTMFIYFISSIAVLIKYGKYLIKDEQEKGEKVKKELTSEYKKVILKDLDSISPTMYSCKAKVDQDGKILCEVTLDAKLKIESCEEFFRFFQFEN